MSFPEKLSIYTPTCIPILYTYTHTSNIYLINATDNRSRNNTIIMCVVVFKYI